MASRERKATGVRDASLHSGRFTLPARRFCLWHFLAPRTVLWMPLSFRAHEEAAFMTRILWSVVLVGCAPAITAGEPKPKLLANGLGSPQAITVGGDGQIYVATVRDKYSAILKIESGRGMPLVTDLSDPYQLVSFQKWLFMSNGEGIWKIDLKGKKELFTPAKDLLGAPGALVVDPESGVVYTTSVGENPSLYRVDLKGKAT